MKSVGVTTLYATTISVCYKNYQKVAHWCTSVHRLRRRGIVCRHTNRGDRGYIMGQPTKADTPRRHPDTPPILDRMAKRVLNYRPPDKANGKDRTREAKRPA